MYRIDNASSVAALPAYDPIGTADRYFDDGTVWDKDFANTLQEEMVNVAIMKGAALVKGTNTQMALALNAVLGMDVHATVLTSGTTDYLTARIAGSGSATGNGAAVVASIVAGTGSIEADGNQSMIGASYSAVSKIEITAAQSAVLASANGTGGPITLSTGAALFVAAATTTTGDIIGSGSRSVVMASDGGVTITGEECFVAGATGDTDADILLGGNRCAVIASSGGAAAAQTSLAGDDIAAIASRTVQAPSGSQYCAAIASLDVDIDSGSTGETHQAAIGVSVVDLAHSYCVAVASSTPGNSPSDKSLYGGDGGTNKWILHSDTGNAYFAGNLNAVGATITFDGLPDGNPGAGTKRLYYDSTDSNRVYFAA